MCCIIGGMVSAVPSHPFDTVKTCMQGDLEQKTFTTFTKSTVLLYKEVCVRVYSIKYVMFIDKYIRYMYVFVYISVYV